MTHEPREGRPGLILFVQSFGDLVTFNPHIHVLGADGLFRADAVFVALPAVPVKLLEQGFRSEVLKLLVAERAIGERLSASMLAWRHSGFSAHNALRARAGKPLRLGGRIDLPIPLSLELGDLSHRPLHYFQRVRFIDLPQVVIDLHP